MEGVQCQLIGLIADRFNDMLCNLSLKEGKTKTMGLIFAEVAQKPKKI